MKKIKARLPSGRVVIRKRRGRVSASVCANCKMELHGTPRKHATEIGKLGKTEKRPSRAYAGYLCFGCTKELFKEKARGI